MLEHQPQYYNLVQLFNGRLFDIPQYQRAYRWEKKHIDALFSDIEQSIDSKQPHFMATVVALRSPKEPVNIFGQVHEHFEIVDGQQRITTLILLLKAISKALDRNDPNAKSYGEVIDRDLVKPDNVSTVLLQTNHDSSRYFDKYIREGEYVAPGNAHILADRRLLVAIGECEGFVKEWRNNGRSLEDLVTHIRNNLTFLFHQISDEALVYTVFEVLNSRGIEVSWFDRLKTMLMAKVFQGGGNTGDSIDRIHQGWASIYRTIGLDGRVDAETLRFTATLRHAEERSRVFGEEASVMRLRGQAENTSDPALSASIAIEITDDLIDVAHALVKLNQDNRLGAVTDISHARLVATAINLRTDLSDADKEAALRCWENVTFRIFGLYRKDARTGVGDYVRLAWRIRQDNLPADEIKSALLKIGKGYSAAKAIEELRKQNCYEGWETSARYFFHRYEEYLAREAGQAIVYEQWNRIWESSPADSIEHILPQSSAADHIHWLGNLTILPPGLNSSLQDDAPTDKAEKYLTETGGLLDAHDVAQRIKVQSGWGKEEIIQRENDLLEWAAQEWGN